MKCLTTAAIVAAVAAPFIAQAAPDGPAFRRDFNGGDSVWQLLDNGVPVEIFAQECVPDGAREDAGAERIILAAPAAHSGLLACATPRLAVLDELQFRLWVKAGRPDIQLAARIVLPRSRDPQGRPLTVIVRGPIYARSEQWQQLILSDVPKLLATQTRVLRTTPGAVIDSREAFVDAVVLVVPGEARGLELFTDELQVDGIILPDRDDVQHADRPSASPALLANREVTLSSHASVSIGSHAPATMSPSRLHGDLLLVDGKPFVPRIIEWRGEPLAFLAERGFNVVQLPAPPDAEQIAAASRHGLWFVCVPPRLEALAQNRLGEVADRVLAWQVFDEPADPQFARCWVESVRDRDAVPGRPVMIESESEWPATSTIFDILLPRHPRLAVLAPHDYELWLESGLRQARPVTPLWSCFATQCDEAVRQQVTALTGAPLASPTVDADQLESMVLTACARCTRGFVFTSASRLDGTDAATRRRALTLERISRKLQLLEPWLASGKVIGRISSSNPGWAGVVLHVGHARLLMPVPKTFETQPSDAATPPEAANSAEATFVVPGVPESTQAYLLSPVTLRALANQRVAGGTKLVVPSPKSSYVLLTEDPQVIQSFRQRIARDGPAFARLQRELAAQNAALVADTSSRLLQLGYRGDAAARAAISATAQLPQIDALLRSGQTERAATLAESLLAVLATTADEQRRGIIANATLASIPLALSYEQLDEYAAVERSFFAVTGGQNLLYAGDFEDLALMTQFGWQHFRHPQPGVASRAFLSADNPQQGTYCLELHTASESTENAQPGMRPASVWVVSPPLHVEPGQRIEITGWVRIDEPLAGNSDGLQIVDSLGGAELSLAVRHTSGWQPFHMVRAASAPSDLRMTFALSGLGTARIDAVMVRVLQQPLAHRLPATAPTSR